MRLLTVFVVSLVALAHVPDLAQAQQRTGPTIGPAPKHACAWVPTRRLIPSPGACGFYGRPPLPKPGNYDCGLVSDGSKCVNRCIFKGCAPGP